ncbi:type II toxin-antitoxin system PemK/MazF family toxin [Brevibacillus agri]|uniref:type II toxin-antitoxin system PemK/MazF family toxin n=1 Tax=Brevibacillus agri TaxID=51101 RepID=UPI002E1F7BE1|nr:type II toxin-antitoxin system PemK/MazF family toxin [Brevibacillus agri]
MSLTKILKEAGIEFIDSSIPEEPKMKPLREYEIGDIFMASLPKDKGSEVIHGTRPVVILNHSDKDRYRIVRIVPLTSRKNDENIKKEIFENDVVLKKKKNPCLSKTSIARVDHSMPISENRLIKKIGKICKNDLDNIKLKLQDLHGIDNLLEL